MKLSSALSMLRPMAPWLGLTSIMTGCFATHYDLTSEGAPRRELMTLSAPPDGWAAPGFDDAAWRQSRDSVATMTPANGVMPTLYVRQRFDVGPDPASYRSLTLSFDIDGEYVAFINEQPMALAGNGQRTITVSAGMLKPLDNVLALAISPRSPRLRMNARLDGDRGPASGGAIVKGPYLLRPTRDGVTVRWQTAAAVSSRAIVDGHAWDGGSGEWHTVEVRGLEANHAYRYHVETDGARSDDMPFTTAPPPGKRLRFVVFGDNRTGGNLHRRLVEEINAEAPDFVVNTGDMVGESNDAEWQKFFDIEYSMLLSTPLYPTMGNHEHDYGDDDTFSELFPLGDPQRNGGRVYSFDYGDAHFAILDSNGGLRSQAKWLDADLADASARGLTSFVVLHWGPVCGCSGFNHGSNDEADPVLDVAARHHVAALFSGHNHLYERGVRNGVTYVVTGGGGAPLQGTGTTGSTQVTFARNHYVLVDLLGKQGRLTAKTAEGELLDDAALSAP